MRDLTHPSWANFESDAEQPWQPVEQREVMPPPHRVLVDTVETHLGDHIQYVYRPKGGRAVFVLPVTTDGDIVLIRQYRYPARQTILEVPAGAIERPESALEAAERELQEEVGGVANEWIPLPAFYPQPSLSGVVIYPFLALGVCLGASALERTELIATEVVSAAEAYRRLFAGEIHDATAGLLLFHARALLQARGIDTGVTF